MNSVFQLPGLSISVIGLVSIVIILFNNDYILSIWCMEHLGILLKGVYLLCTGKNKLMSWFKHEPVKCDTIFKEQLILKPSWYFHLSSSNKSKITCLLLTCCFHMLVEPMNSLIWFHQSNECFRFLVSYTF